MKSISIGRSKVTEFQVDKILSGEKVNKVMSIWDKIKDLFNIGDKKQVLTLLYDVYYNPEVSLLDKLDKFKELTRLSLNDFHNDFSIEIEKGTFYFEIIKTEGDSINDRLIISQFLYENECDITNLYKNQSVSFLFNKSSENEIENLNKMIEKKINEINKLKDKDNVDKIDSIRSYLLLMQDDSYRDNALDSFKKENSPLNKLTSKKVCSGMTPKEAMDKTWEIIKENSNKIHNDYELSALIQDIFDDGNSVTYETINSYLKLAEIINQKRNILNVDFTDEKVTFYLLDENNRKIISNEYINDSSTTKKFNFELSAFEHVIQSKDHEYNYNKSISEKDRSDLNKFLSAYSVLSEKSNKENKNFIFINMLKIKQNELPLNDKLEVIKNISNIYDKDNEDKTLRISVSEAKQIGFEIKNGKDKNLEQNPFYLIPYNDENLDSLNIDVFNKKNLSNNDKIKILSNLDNYHKNMTILKSKYYHDFKGLSEIKKEFYKIETGKLMDESDIDIFKISESELNMIKNLPKSLAHPSIIDINDTKDINKIFEYYKHLCFIKGQTNIDDKTIDILIANGSKEKKKIENVFTEELYNDIKSKKPKELKILKNQFKDKNFEFKYNDKLFSKIIDSASDMGKKCIYTLLSKNFFFDKLAEEFYKNEEVNNTPYLVDFEIKKDHIENEEIIKIKISKKREKNILTPLILSNNSLFSSPADFLNKKLENAKLINNQKSPINSPVLSNEIEITVRINKIDQSKIKITGNHNQISM
ncbi:hypothetical protein [Proteus columbae]|uniref:hypothetical protein n=1 Tax=Proteus columbae TaxID=1987580 RepID=UPI00288B3D99|nr:hypothetical protein [Proteus columbae]